MEENKDKLYENAKTAIDIFGKEKDKKKLKELESKKRIHEIEDEER